MSFAKIVKEELVSYSSSEKDILSELMAFVKLNAEIVLTEKQKNLEFRSSNPTVAKRFLQLIRKQYKAETVLITKQENKLKQKKTIIIRVVDNVDRIISDCHYFENNYVSIKKYVETETQKRAFLRGAFLSSGSINHPETAEYHLEIYATNSNDIQYIQYLMNEFYLDARITTRRKGYIAYIKEAEKISNFLSVIGAEESMFTYEDIRIKRDFSNSINRLMNCEIANEKKVIVAANEQLKDIELIEHHDVIVDDKLKKIINLRKENPDDSLRELVVKYEEVYNEKISRSGMNHRLLKLKKLADEIKESKK